MHVIDQAMSLSPPIDELLRRIQDRTAKIGVLGLGYVGLPLATSFAEQFHVTGFDPDRGKVETINMGHSHILDVSSETVRRSVQAGMLRAETDFSLLGDCDAILICVPTPLARDKDPDLSYVQKAAHNVARYLRPGQLIVLESTTYPGTTNEFMLPLFSADGLELDKDFLLAFSPERVDPGNVEFNFTDITKVIGGCSPSSTEAATLLYGSIMRDVFPVSSARVAETSKLLENTFRSVNIALANEVALLCHQLGIDTQEVIEAASTKPFGFMPFYPGPGVGGHCIPLDPLYLSWRAKQQGFNSRMIATADEINSSMPTHVIRRISEALNEHGKAVNGARILLLGVTYKGNVNDMRHSPAAPIVDRLRAHRAQICYHDDFVPYFEVDLTEWPEWRRRDEPIFEDRRRRLNASPVTSGSRRRSDRLESLPLTEELLGSIDCTVIVTKHDGVNYDDVARLSPLIVDTRRALNSKQRTIAKGKLVDL